MSNAPPSRRAVTVGICTLVVAVAFEYIAVATAMPAAAADLRGLGWYAWAFSGFLIGMLVSTVVSGHWSDRAGPTPPLIAGLVVFGCGLVVAGTAGAMPVLVAGRFVQGLGSGLVNVALYVVVARVYPPDRRPRVFTYISTAWVLPAFVGPPVAAWLTHHLSWHWVFLAIVPLLAVGAGLTLPSLTRLPQSEVPAAQQASPVGAALLVATGAVALQYAGQRLDLLALLPAALGLAALAVGLPRLMPPGILRMRPGLPSVVLTRGLLAGAFTGAEAFVPLMLVEQRSLPLLGAGLVLTVGAVGWFAGAWLQSESFVRVRRDHLVVSGAGSLLVGLCLLAGTAGVPTWWSGLAVVGWACCGVGMGLGTASLTLAVMMVSGPAEQGRNASSLNLAEALGSSLFVGVSGAVYAGLRSTAGDRTTFTSVFGVMAVVAVLTVVAATRIGRLPEPAPRLSRGRRQGGGSTQQVQPA